MGASNFVMTWTGTDYEQGYRELCRETEFEYGHDYYNGTISTTHLSRRQPTKIAERWSATADKRANKFIDEHDGGVKWECRVLDLGVTGYEVAKFVKVPHTSADVQFQTRFVAYADEQEIGTYKTAAEARAALEKVIGLRKYAKTQCFHVEKKPVKVCGTSTTTCAYERQVRIAKTKPKTTPKGTTVTPIHKFVYYGWAAC